MVTTLDHSQISARIIDASYDVQHDAIKARAAGLTPLPFLGQGPTAAGKIMDGLAAQGPAMTPLTSAAPAANASIGSLVSSTSAPAKMDM